MSFSNTSYWSRLWVILYPFFSFFFSCCLAPSLRKPKHREDRQNTQLAHKKLGRRSSLRLAINGHFWMPCDFQLFILPIQGRAKAGLQLENVKQSLSLHSFINHCILFHTKHCRPTFASPCVSPDGTSEPRVGCTEFLSIGISHVYTVADARAHHNTHPWPPLSTDTSSVNVTLYLQYHVNNSANFPRVRLHKSKIFFF